MQQFLDCNWTRTRQSQCCHLCEDARIQIQLIRCTVVCRYKAPRLTATTNAQTVVWSAYVAFPTTNVACHAQLRYFGLGDTAPTTIPSEGRLCQHAGSQLQLGRLPRGHMRCLVKTASQRVSVSDDIIQRVRLCCIAVGACVMWASGCCCSCP